MRDSLPRRVEVHCGCEYVDFLEDVLVEIYSNVGYEYALSGCTATATKTTERDSRNARILTLLVLPLGGLNGSHDGLFASVWHLALL